MINENPQPNQNKKKTEPANANRIDITNKINKVFEWNN